MEKIHSDVETTQKETSKLSDSDINKKGQETSNKIKEIREAERIDSMKDELMKIGKITSDNPKANFFFSDKSGNKDTMKIDMSKQTLEFQGKTIKIELPKGATMSNIVFSSETVTIEGKVGFFSGSGTAQYKELIQAIDNVMQKGSYTLIAGKEQIGFRLA